MTSFFARVPFYLQTLTIWMVFGGFEVWAKNLKVFDLKFGFSEVSPGINFEVQWLELKRFPGYLFVPKKLVLHPNMGLKQLLRV